MTLHVAIYVYPQVEVLDFAGPYEVYTTATRVQQRLHPDMAPLFAVCTVARSAAPVRARAGLVVVPDHGFETLPDPDLLVIPGGVVDAELDDPAVLDWLQRTARRAGLTASVCTGSFLLAQAGLLRGKPVTTHWEDVADLRQRFPTLEVREQVRWVNAGEVVSSAGIAAGIDMSLYLVARLAGETLARATARQMDYPFPD